jgi:acyl-CoA reductase-like NAD-dependent aldehyde dehydrogenase
VTLSMKKESPNMLQCVSPIDGNVYFERPLATVADIERVLAKAHGAQKAWRKAPLAEKQKYMLKALDYFLSRAEQIGEELSWMMGRPASQAVNEIKRGFQERLRYMVEIAPKALANITPEAKEGFKRYIKREPLGVVAVIAPWNYPYLTSVNAIVPSLLAGNTVILKHSHQTPLCADHYMQAFQEAGLPEGAFQFIELSHADMEKMIADPRINHVAFTGSVNGGHAVQKALNHKFIAPGLELGGKDPAYVRADADLNYAVENLIDGAFFNSGQSCCGIERIYVHASLYDGFVKRFVELTKTSYKLGNPLDKETNLGPMVRASSADFVRGQIQAAVNQGAQALIDERLFPMSKAGTPYMAPQVLVNVDHSMAVMTEESFGPVIGIMKVSSDEEAIKLMNDSAYGLTASLWTADLNVAEKIADEIETGTVYMNRCDYLDPALAWTGVKDTGRGATLSILGFENVTRPKSFHLKTKI